MVMSEEVALQLAQEQRVGTSHPRGSCKKPKEWRKGLLKQDVSVNF